MRRRPPVIDEAEGGLPANLAAGPVPEIWGDKPSDAKGAWVMAGCAWSRANALGEWGWLRLLPADIRYTYLPTAREQSSAAAGHPLTGDAPHSPIGGCIRCRPAEQPNRDGPGWKPQWWGVERKQWGQSP